VPTVGVQHGIIYPRYFSYLHDADDEACPRPDRIAVFGEAARRFLAQEGRFRAETLVVTGSPKFDALVEAARCWDREALRAKLGVRTDEKLVVVASRHRGIRPTHQAIGTAFPALLRAVEAMDGVRLVVKPHPAEPADAYRADIRGAGVARTRVLPPSTDLMELLHAADGLVTVESLSAVEALVLGRPVVILNMPSNLAEMVSRGVALGVGVGEDPSQALRELLYSQRTRQRLMEARQHYLSDVAFGLDGQATARIMALIRETAGAHPMVG
jgi:UDP-N-acetylglucosamine 2-epimerase